MLRELRNTSQLLYIKPAARARLSAARSHVEAALSLSRGDNGNFNIYPSSSASPLNLFKKFTDIGPDIYKNIIGEKCTYSGAPCSVQLAAYVL